MNISLQKEKAQVLLALHFKDEALILPNIWSPLGARILEEKGFTAVATASAAISASLGYKDGEKIKFTTLMDIASRIASSVSVPTTVDIESGFSSTHHELITVIGMVLDAGIVGINIEDSFEDGLRNIKQQASRICVIRKVAQDRGIHLVINARIDCFLLDATGNKQQKINATIERANAYLEAGADCIFPIGIDDIDTLKHLRQIISAPINVLVLPEKMTMQEMFGICINRFSYGPFIFRAVLKSFITFIDQLNELGTNQGLKGNMLSYQETQQYLCELTEK